MLRTGPRPGAVFVDPDIYRPVMVVDEGLGYSQVYEDLPRTPRCSPSSTP